MSSIWLIFSESSRSSPGLWLGMVYRFVMCRSFHVRSCSSPACQCELTNRKVEATRQWISGHLSTCWCEERPHGSGQTDQNVSTGKAPGWPLKMWSAGLALLLTTSCLDIITVCLVYGISAYTCDQFQNDQPPKAHGRFINGCVQGLFTFRLKDCNNTMLTASVIWL